MKMILDTFPKALKLGEKIEVIVPSTYDRNHEINNDSFVEYTLKNMSLVFGGATAISGKGGFMSESGELIEEEVTKVYSFTDELTGDKMKIFLEIVSFLKRELKQESIGIEINNKFYLV